MKNKYLFFVLLALGFLGSSTIIAQKNAWAVPEYSKGLKNPFDGKSNATAEGKAMNRRVAINVKSK